MFDTTIIDGKQVAAARRADLTGRVAQLGHTPVLKVILLGDDPASLVYVRNKTIAAQQVGIDSEIIKLPIDTSEIALLRLIEELNHSPMDGIIVQLPLPPHIHADRVLEAIHPSKDVDGFHPLNIGRLASGRRTNVPCTPKGIMGLLKATDTPLEGARALMVGCSAIVGRPTSMLLTQAHATVTCAHKMTRDLAAECSRADIVIVAAGCPNLVRGWMIQPGAVVIDVGINRLDNGRLCGDVAFEECLGIARAITPVPGGVGPMTVACLLENTYEAAARHLAD